MRAVMAPLKKSAENIQRPYTLSGDVLCSRIEASKKSSSRSAWIRPLVSSACALIIVAGALFAAGSTLSSDFETSADMAAPLSVVKSSESGAMAPETAMQEYAAATEGAPVVGSEKKEEPVDEAAVECEDAVGDDSDSSDDANAIFLTTPAGWTANVYSRTDAAADYVEIFVFAPDSEQFSACYRQSGSLVSAYLDGETLVLETDAGKFFFPVGKQDE